MAIAKRGSVNPASQAENDSILNIRSDLETQRAKIDSMVNALAILADWDSDLAPLFFSLMNAIEPANDELDRIINRLIAFEPRNRPARAEKGGRP